MSYREPSKPAGPKPRVTGGPASVIAIVIALVSFCWIVMWLSAARGG